MEKDEVLKRIRLWAAYAGSDSETIQEWTTVKEQLGEVLAWIEAQGNPQPISQEAILMDTMNTVEAAHALNKKKQTLEKWRSLGYGPKYIKVGNAVYYRLEELRRWITESNGKKDGV